MWLSKSIYKQSRKRNIRVFYNKNNDIIQTISQDNKDIFLWEESNLNIIESKNGINYISHIIELKDHPFKTYEK